MNTTRIPARTHTKARRYGPRIQKKWIKRWGYLFVGRASEGRMNATDPNPQSIPMLGRRARQAESAARAANPLREEELRAAWERKLIKLCDDMIEECRVGGWTVVQFNVADEAEREFIQLYMEDHAPLAKVEFTVAGVRV